MDCSNNNNAITTNGSVLNLSVKQYASFNMDVQITDSGSVPVSLVSWSFTGSVKQSYSNANTLVTFSITVLDVTQSVIQCYLGPAETGLLNKRTPYYYDIIGTNISVVPAQVFRIVEGTITADLGVTPSPII